MRRQTSGGQGGVEMPEVRQSEKPSCAGVCTTTPAAPSVRAAADAQQAEVNRSKQRRRRRRGRGRETRTAHAGRALELGARAAENPLLSRANTRPRHSAERRIGTLPRRSPPPPPPVRRSAVCSESSQWPARPGSVPVECATSVCRHRYWIVPFAQGRGTRARYLLFCSAFACVSVWWVNQRFTCLIFPGRQLAGHL